MHNPAVFRAHFSGQGLPGFKGTRIQRGGSISGIAGMAANALSRYAVPLLMAGATAAAPHIGKAVGNLAQGAAKRIFPNDKAMQQVVGSVANRAASTATGAVANRVLQKKRKRAGGRTTSVKRRAATSRNIFS